MSVVESLHRNLKREDDAIERDRHFNEEIIWGESAKDVEVKEDGEMMIAGDNNLEIHHHHEAPKPDPKPPVPEKSLAEKALPYVATAMLAGSCLGGAALVANAMKAAPPVVQEFEDTFGVLELDRDE